LEFLLLGQCQLLLLLLLLGERLRLLLRLCPLLLLGCCLLLLRPRNGILSWLKGRYMLLRLRVLLEMSLMELIEMLDLLLLDVLL
jgi:hypothetical protein